MYTFEVYIKYRFESVVIFWYSVFIIGKLFGIRTLVTGVALLHS